MHFPRTAKDEENDKLIMEQRAKEQSNKNQSTDNRTDGNNQASARGQDENPQSPAAPATPRPNAVRTQKVWGKPLKKKNPKSKKTQRT